MINTNLIIGRLGSGKTTCIKHLIRHIPAHEFWLIIVNEFGQIGIDEALLSDQQNDSISITEINGGCICCAAQSQLQVILTSLIRKRKPDRIIIEATGLGHPAGIVDMLRSEYLRSVISVNSVITVTDLSLFSQPFEALDKTSPLTTESFTQQIQLADIVILNKIDLAGPSNFEYATAYLQSIFPHKMHIIDAKNAEFDLKYLSMSSDLMSKPSMKSPHSMHNSSSSEKLSYKDTTIECFSSESDEYMSFGLIFPASVVFKRKHLQELFQNYLSNADFKIVRLKGVFNCGRLWHAFNAIDSTMNTEESYYRRDSRVELIYQRQLFDSSAFKDALFTAIE
ncbi:MAG: GTP-binding protein [Gammaproteobacteria bacterium]|nr:GTP-binding protein [Gammaproteobacteria bacterium]